MSCEICPIIQQPSHQERALRLIEGDYWRATLRQADQSLLGTTFVTAKRHVPSLGELSQSEWNEFADINKRLERALMQSFGAAVINTSCLMNLAFRQPSPEPHVHLHLKPRYSSPVVVQGQEFTDPHFGSYLDGHHPRQRVSDNLALNIVAIIQRNT